jgi:hypothetical protein
MFTDADEPGRGHRLNLMDANWREIGIGVRAQSNYIYLGTGYNAVMAVEDFAFTGGDPFRTGVAYVDADHYGLYTPGEGLGNVTITATRYSDGQVFSTTTIASGGYSLRLAAGTYNLAISGSGLGSLVRFGRYARSAERQDEFSPCGAAGLQRRWLCG